MSKIKSLKYRLEPADLFLFFLQNVQIYEQQILSRVAFHLGFFRSVPK